MVAGLKPGHLQRYKDVGMLLLKFGPADLIERTGLQDFLRTDPGKPIKPELTQGASELTCEFERLGPAFIKLGQILALRADVLPAAYIDALSHVGEHEAAVVPYSQIEHIIQAELPLFNKDFQSIEQKPKKISSLSQWHGAILKNGTNAILKIERPGVRERIYDDFEALQEVAQFCDDHTKTGKSLDLAAAFDQFRSLIVSELDLKQVASQLVIFKENMKEVNDIVVPTAMEQYSARDVLTTDYVEARALASFGAMAISLSERKRLAEQLVYACFKQALLDGFICTRLNQNNIAVTKEGHLAFLATGPFLKLNYSTQEKLTQLLMAIRQGKTEHAADVLISLSKRAGGFDEGELHRRIGELLRQRQAASMLPRIGATLVGLSKACVETGLKIIPEFPILAGTFYNMERSALALDPKLDTTGYLEQHLTEVARKHMAKALSPQSLFHNAVEMADFLEKMPAKISRILDALAANNLKMTVHTIDEVVLISGFQKIANRIALALVLAALIMGAALLMRVPTSFSILGYPGLAMICFIAAAFFAFTLVVEIMISDRR